jgi:seryl-tRNA synthetase
VLDIRRIRSEPQEVKAALLRRGEDFGAAIDAVLECDERWRGLTRSAEETKAEQNAVGKRIGELMRDGADATEAMRRSSELKAQLGPAEEQARRAGAELEELLLAIPNLPDPSAAAGPGDELIREVGEVPKFDFEPRDHLELAGERIDMDRAARLSGSRFAYLKGDLVMLELALVRWVLEKLRGEGFEPVIPPVLVRERALFGTGFLPDTEQQIYRLADDDLYLVGTSEVALASLHDGEILEAGSLPLRYAGFSPCFRREAGAAGRDTRGIFRVHQFDKVEMFSFVDPDHSTAEHERILAIEEQILTELGLAYRVVNIAVSDLGGSAAKKYDCEAWLAGQGRYRELTSCSNTTDYQARRLNIRVRREKRIETLHTLNGTAVAVGRTIIALLENGQRADGGVLLPACLGAFGAPRELAAQ